MLLMYSCRSNGFFDLTAQNPQFFSKLVVYWQSGAKKKVNSDADPRQKQQVRMIQLSILII